LLSMPSGCKERKAWTVFVLTRWGSSADCERQCDANRSVRPMNIKSKSCFVLTATRKSKSRQDSVSQARSLSGYL
jgi:hypothetical protein